jgi:Protein of unknown function (DUF3185)
MCRPEFTLKKAEIDAFEVLYLAPKRRGSFSID